MPPYIIKKHQISQQHHIHKLSVHSSICSSNEASQDAFLLVCRTRFCCVIQTCFCALHLQEVLTAFSTVPRSFAKVVLQTAGDFDYDNLFEEASLLYTPMAIILFITFVVLMPILFSNLLVSIYSNIITLVLGSC